MHAIKGGIEILEHSRTLISHIGCMIMDVSKTAKPRELHIEKSIDVITVPAKSVKESVINIATDAKNTMNELISYNYYRVWKLDVDGSMEISQEYPFLIMSVVEGDGLINGQLLKKGDHFILPKGFGKSTAQGKMALIASTIA